MNNTDYGHITPELLDQVTTVLEDAANHKYSVSRIYGAHNQVFQLQEKPESCASCLRKRASALKTWYGEYAMSQTDANVNPNQGNILFQSDKGVEVDTIFGKAVVSPELAEIAAASTKPLTEPIVEAGVENEVIEVTAQALGALSLKDKDGNTLEALFNSEDGVKGTLNTPDGKALKPGTYTTAEGATYTVQPGGKATLKDDLL